MLGSYVHAADVADGIRRAARVGRPGAHYVLGGENLSFRAFLSPVGALSGTSERVVTLPRGGAPGRGGGVLTSARLVRARGGPAGAAAPLRRRRAAPRRDPGARRPAGHGTHAARLGARARGLAGGPGVAGGWGATRDPGRSDRRPGPRDACRVSPRSDAHGRPARVRAVRGAAVSLLRLVGGAVPRRAAVRAPRAVRRRVVQR